LATRWVSAVAHAPIESKIKEFLGIPREMMVYEMMAVGYSDFEPLPKRLRPLSQIVHSGICGEGDFRSDTEVAEYFQNG